MFPRLESRFGLQPFQKARDISVVKIRSESRSTLFKAREFIFGNTSGIFPEIVEVTRYQHKLFVSFKLISGPHVVTHFLLVSTVFSRLLSTKATVEEILLASQPSIHTHCIDERTVAGTPL